MLLPCTLLIDIPHHVIPVIFQVASLLAALTHPSHRVIYTLHLSSCCFVGCVHLPSPCNLKSIGYIRHVRVILVYFVFFKAIKLALFL
ncbi:hypothetical protein EAE89_13480 [Photorhabdus heterorhabditis]|nr:hypothetical protein [Photorhabdus heterorhabditis]